MKSIFKASIAMLMVMMLVMGMFTGCGGEKTNNESQGNVTAGSVSQSEAAVKPLSTEPIKVTAWIGETWITDCLDITGNDPIAKKLAEKTGVTLEMQSAKTSDPESELNIMMASDELPDIIVKAGPSISKLRAGGYIAALDEAIDKYAPNLKSRMPEALKSWQDPEDGRTYVVKTWIWNTPKYTLYTDSNLFMRYDILKELNYENLNKDNSPFIAWDAYENLLKQVKAKYPDMTPLLRPQCQSLLESTGVTMDPSSASIYEDGSFKWTYGSKNMLECVKYANRLYNEGLVLKGYATMKDDQYKSLLASGKVFSTYGKFSGFDEANASLTQSGDEKRLAAFPMVQSASTPLIYLLGFTKNGAGATMISSKSKYMDRIVQLFDYTSSEEGSLLIFGGLEGVSYTKDETGKVIPGEEILKAYASWDTTVFKKTGIFGLMNIFPGLAGVDANGNAADFLWQNTIDSDKWTNFNIKGWEKFSFERLTEELGNFDPESQKAAAEAKSKIGSYIEDKFTAAVISAPDKCEGIWNSAVEQMNKDGMDEITKALNDNAARISKSLGIKPEELILNKN